MCECVGQHKFQKIVHIEKAIVQNAQVLSSKVMASKSLHTFKCQTQKIIVDLSRKLTLFVFEHVKELEHSVQHIIIEKFLSHSLVQGMLLGYFLDMYHVKHNHDVVSNMKSNIMEHLTSQQKSQLVVTKEIVCMLASSSSIVNSPGVLQNWQVWINITFEKPQKSENDWIP